jgi:hypothetical protein
MKTSWQTEADRIVCRWSEAGKHVQYNPLWLQDVSRSIDTRIPTAVPDFTTHSLLGSGEWFVPWNARWSVPGKSIN